MKTLDKILSYLILTTLVVAITLQIIRNGQTKANTDVPQFELSQVQETFPEAEYVIFLDTAYYGIMNADDALIGYMLTSSPYSDHVKGYAGRTPLHIFLDKEENIAQIKLLPNQETPGFLTRVINSGYLENWQGLSIDEALNTNVDAVSGATYSSLGIQNTLKARLAVASRQQVNAPSKPIVTPWPNLCILFVIILALICFFFPQKTKTLRLVTLLLSIGIIGFWKNALLSLLKIYGWLISGIAWPLEWVIVVLFALAVFLPLVTGKAFYCAYVCPMGALQELTKKACKKSISLPKKLTAILLIVRKVFFLSILILLACGVSLDLAYVEPFSVFSVKSVTFFSIAFAVIVLTVSLFIPRAWCRFLCPTGLLLDLIRQIGSKRKAH